MSYPPGTSQRDHDAAFGGEPEEPEQPPAPPSPTDALRAVLLFHRDGPWGGEEQEEWERLTGRTDATTKALCDAVRAALGDG